MKINKGCWIPVTEKMPPTIERKGIYPVLVTVVDCEGELFTTPMLTDGKGRWFTLNPPLGSCREQVIAWQYFPAPYVA